MDVELLDMEVSVCLFLKQWDQTAKLMLFYGRGTSGKKYEGNHDLKKADFEETPQIVKILLVE